MTRKEAAELPSKPSVAPAVEKERRIPMRLLPALALITLSAFDASAQESRVPPRMPLAIRIASMDQLKEASNLLARRLELDAFVSTRLAAAGADLEDFRTAAAIAKARGRVEEARMRYSETRSREPRSADPRIGQILGAAGDILEQAERNSGAVLMPGVQKDLMRESGRMQRVLYDDLDEAQRVRKSISDMQKGLNLMAEDLDTALEQALGAMFAYLRSGGQ
jgi:hypothetical protein